MTTSRSPLRVLKAQADTIAKTIKAVERGENPVEDSGGRIAAARNKSGFKVGVVMDDKVLVVEMSWATISEASEVGIAEFILKHMKGSREAAHAPASGMWRKPPKAPAADQGLPGFFSFRPEIQK